MSFWLDRPLAIVDLETTGGDPRFDRITEVGLVLVDETGVRVWDSLVNPGQSIPATIQRFTGITDSMVAQAPRFSALAHELGALLEGRLFVAHNARFDQGFLRNEFARAGIDFSPRVLCSVKLSRALYPQHARHGLDALIERFQIGCDARHRALGDARVVFEFLQRVHGDFSRPVLEAATKKAMQTSASPPGLPPGALADLPEAPGVYLFYGAPPAATDLLPPPQELPLYVGKSVNLRARVMSHFSGSHRGGQAARLMREIRRVDWQETAGEIGALLCESQWVKRLQPLYNKQLRRAEPAVALARIESGEGEAVLCIVELEGLHPKHLKDLYGPFRSRRDAQSALRELALAWQLCPKRIGLQESGRVGSPCFSAQIKRCLGVCCGREAPATHDLRLASALATRRMPLWPYRGRVLLRECRPGRERGDLHLLENWCYLGSQPEADEAHVRAWASEAAEPVFDFDIYQILKRYLGSLPNGVQLVALDASVSA